MNLKKNFLGVISIGIFDNKKLAKLIKRNLIIVFKLLKLSNQKITKKRLEFKFSLLSIRYRKKG